MTKGLPAVLAALALLSLAGTDCDRRRGSEVAVKADLSRPPVPTRLAPPTDTGAESHPGPTCTWGTQAKPILVPAPEYPPEEKQTGIEGRVIISALVDVDGRVKEVEVRGSSGNDRLDAAAAAAAAQAQFRPAMRDGKPVRAWVALPYWFSLTDDR